MPGVVTIRLIVHGRVQGVSYRRWAAAAAKEKSLSGWVRNLKDGSVEMALSGPQETVEAMKQACYKGPPLAKVTGIDTEPFTEQLNSGFETLPTA